MFIEFAPVRLRINRAETTLLEIGATMRCKVEYGGSSNNSNSSTAPKSMEGKYKIR